MYCPNCSQQQVSDEVRFCSRCGFSLIAVRELVASGSPPVERGAEPQAGQLSRSQKGVRKGAWMMLASLLLTIFVGFLIAVDEEFAVFLLLPLLIFVIGFLRVLYGVFLADKRARRVKGAAAQPPAVPVTPGQLDAAARAPALAAPRAAPAESFAVRRAQTAEMVQPPSVTENTTRLLDEESDPRRG
jgi:predicted lipid-binding transport protein (Tim44 family)